MNITKTINGEVNRVSLVDEPANGSYICSERMCNIHENIVTAVVLIANQPIYRKPVNGKDERFVIFTEAVVESAAHQFLMRNMNNNLSTDHSPFLSDNIKMAESFVIDGVWRVKLAIEDVELLNDVKSGKYKGLSIEGVFTEVVLLEVSDDLEKFERDAEALSDEDKQLVFGNIQ